MLNFLPTVLYLGLGMAYEVYLRRKDEDLSLDAYLEMFSKRKNCRVEGQQVIYENADTGVGFYYDFLNEGAKDASEVRPDGIYRIVLRVEYCQPAFFFVEALHEIYDLVQHEDFYVYDPQINESSGGEAFSDKKLFLSWRECNLDAVNEYMLSLGAEMDDVPMMPFEALKRMWEWNYAIRRLRDMLDQKIRIPTIQAINFADEDLTAVVWKDGGPIAIPYVDIIVFARSISGGDEYDFCAVDYEDVKPLIDKYSEKNFANAFVLSYDIVPEEISDFIKDLDSDIEFIPMDMCDILEYEVAETALFPDAASSAR